MQQPSTFNVYNASAGSGKTFTLVKQYLKVLLTSDNIFTFQNVLAITFTNKAAGEMKERVLFNLEEFAAGKQNDVLKIIIDETSLDKTLIVERSKRILDAILQNYSAFSITTIDSFTHKIIKSFAYDLGLSLNFEVEMDAVSLLNEAVDVLISKIGTDKKLTKLLIDYSLDKTDDDKSWDISNDLNEFSRVLLNEDDVKHFRKLQDKSLDDFFELKEKLQQKNKKIEASFEELGNKVLSFINQNGLNISDFAYTGEYFKHFKKFTKLRFLKSDELKFDGRLNTTIENEKNLFAGKTSADVKETIKDISPELRAFYYESKVLYENNFSGYLLNKIALKSIIPLAVLNNINSELNTIKEDNNIRLNAEFNQLISDNIKDQPAPYIYERIGQRFQNYFIDEMQDTSELQWQNLIPLIDNALAQENSNLLLVGDGKQAIYRWRGGKAEQFIDLGSENGNHFHIQKNVQNLETNYRSYSEVINFNNSFFQHTAKFIQNESYKKLFVEGNTQLENSKKGGYVSLSFLDKLEKDEEKLKYPKKVLEKINLLKEDFYLNEICVLTRTKKDGIAVADYLSENGISIISSETLLLKNNAKINFIIDVLKIIQNPKDEERRFEFLYFLHEHLQIEIPKHQFFQKHIKSDNATIFAELQQHNIVFDYNVFQQAPFYEKIEEIVRGFYLVNSSDAYIQFFLDVVLEQQRKGTEIGDFLEFWELKKDKLSIVASENSDAVQVMTIHKSKGLEFPVVIFPCDVELYRQIKPKVWFNDLPEDYNFKELLIDYKKDLSLINQRGLDIFNQQREELELDNFNLLYVALTRAVEQLHVITEKKISAKGVESVNYYSGIFINYLKEQNLWQDDLLEYEFGDVSRKIEKVKQESLSEVHQKFISNPWQEHNIVLLASASKLWNTEQGKAIDFGNLFHEILSKIKTKNDVDFIVNQYHQQGFINTEQLEYILKSVNTIVNHKDLKSYFSDEVTVFNEREIVDFDNQIIIPDRLVVNSKNEAIIIDYKTGAPSNEHHQQLLKYGIVLESMHFNVSRKLLVYINDKIDVVEV
ncbi:exodeoxyribonuclease V subunit beta [Polaribacter sp. KT 15]|uniref:UvrD-helicase domain-containing protein n=1 Tax=Polaribacter sp. KT 15 TaxID=1896175 RepID=UPI00090CB63C|nr:UvrD-helicase domain-containing protein [Polaribacter sp. KT 15]SHM86243.1 ATP-dependent exoDNAse (exonuclease V) beta subunit (contains helicase and exonuclease domains) [Polaribacter sp. KT 15]